MLLSDVWRLSVAYIGPNSRTERPRKTKIGKEVAHVTRDSDTTFKVKRSRSPGRFAHRLVGALVVCSGGRENVLAVGNCCYVAVCSAAQGASAPTGGMGHTVAAARLQLVPLVFQSYLGTTMFWNGLCRFVVVRILRNSNSVSFPICAINPVDKNLLTFTFRTLLLCVVIRKQVWTLPHANSSSLLWRFCVVFINDFTVAVGPIFRCCHPCFDSKRLDSVEK